MTNILLTLLGITSTGLFFAQTIIMNEDFQSGIPSSWQTVKYDENFLHPSVSEYESGAWISIVDPTNSIDTVASSTSYFDPAGNADRWLVSPVFVLGSFGNTISWTAKSGDASYPDSYQLRILTTDSNIVVQNVYSEQAYWTDHTIDLSSFGLDNKTASVVFILNTFDGYKLFLDDIVISKETSVGIEDLPTLNFQVYPNPTSQFLTINCQFELDEYSLFDTTGKLVISGNSKKVDLSLVDKGMYLLEVKSGNQKSVQRIIKN
jgi:hypothetical protein